MAFILAQPSPAQPSPAPLGPSYWSDADVHCRNWNQTLSTNLPYNNTYLFARCLIAYIYGVCIQLSAVVQDEPMNQSQQVCFEHLTATFYSTTTKYSFYQGF